MTTLKRLQQDQTAGDEKYLAPEIRQLVETIRAKDRKATIEYLIERLQSKESAMQYLHYTAEQAENSPVPKYLRKLIADLKAEDL